MMARIESADWPTQPKAHLMMMYLKETFNEKIEEQDTVKRQASIHWMWQNEADKEHADEKLVQSNMPGKLFEPYCTDHEKEDHEDEEKETDLKDDDSVIFVQLYGVIDESSLWKFDGHYAEEEKENIQDVEDEREMIGEESENSSMPMIPS
jgi:hypothetical protein